MVAGLRRLRHRRDLLGSVETGRPRQARTGPAPAPITAETALRLWTPTASGGYRLTYVDDGQPVGLIANNKAEWTLVPAHPRNVYVSEVGETQYQG